MLADSSQCPILLSEFQLKFLFFCDKLLIICHFIVLVVNQKTEFVLIHDAVRPFIEENTLKDILLAAVETGVSGKSEKYIMVVCSCIDGLRNLKENPSLLVSTKSYK